MVEIVQLLQAPAMMVKAALHFIGFLHPGQMNPLELGVPFSQHFREARPEIVVGPAYILNLLAALGELKHAEYSLGHEIYIFLRKSFPVSHGRI